MLPTSCPPKIWTISLNFVGSLHSLVDILACELQDVQDEECQQVTKDNMACMTSRENVVKHLCCQRAFVGLAVFGRPDFDQTQQKTALSTRFCDAPPQSSPLCCLDLYLLTKIITYENIL